MGGPGAHAGTHMVTLSESCHISEHARCPWAHGIIEAARAMMLNWSCECGCHTQPDYRDVEPYASDPVGDADMGDV